MSRVAVLMGGMSAEREVSLSSAAGIVKALASIGHEVDAIDVTHDIAGLVTHLTRTKPDVVFNALHGRWGEDGCVQGLLELLGLPYTYSGVQASAIAMDKVAAKRVFAAHGIRCPDGTVTHRSRAHDVLPRPYVVKPIAEGSSVGVIIVREGANAQPLDAATWRFGDEVLVESYIPGRELTVACMDQRVLGVLEIKPYQGFYDYETKYTENKAEHVIPADVPPVVRAKAEWMARTAHTALGCRGVTRCDMRWDDSVDGADGLYLLEINTQPGMTPTSLVPEIAAHVGIDFPALVGWMVEHARCDA